MQVSIQILLYLVLKLYQLHLLKREDFARYLSVQFQSLFKVFIIINMEDFNLNNMGVYINEQYFMGKLRAPNVNAEFLGIKREIYLYPQLTDRSEDKSSHVEIDNSSEELEDETENYCSQNVFRLWEEENSEESDRPHHSESK